MISRRHVLIGSAASAAAVFARRTVSMFATASQPMTAVNFSVPAGACDTHTHIFGDPRTFPFSPKAPYKPETASIDEMRSLHRALHMDRVVIVQPSVYGTDNRCTLDAVKQLGPRARCIMVIDDKTPDAALDDMYRGGARGIRINLITAGQTDLAVARRLFESAAGRMRGRDHWHIQLYVTLSTIEALKDVIAASPVPVVFDHFGDAQAPLGVGQPGFDTMLNMLRSGRAYVKISGAYRSSKQTPDFPDVTPLAKAIIAANPQRVLWGSDWPHPNPGAKVAPDGTTPFWPGLDDGRLLNQVAVWAPDAAQRKLILVDNPARLYGF
jgi:predicted TIM-barrel fold metal-dependent hydrolase